jgi:lipopolysaccharide heptosyltransferase II
MESTPSHLPSSILYPRRILLRGTNWLGDAVMTTPALLRLREQFPDAHIALLTPEKLKDLWIGHPAVNETVSFTSGESIFWVAKRIRQVGSSRRDDRTAQRAVPTPFDLALVLPNSPRSAMETWLAGIPRRIGYARPWRNWFLTQAVMPRPDATKMRKRPTAEIRQLISANSKFKIQNSKFTPAAHQIHEYLHLVAALGAMPEPLPPQLFVSTNEIEAAKKKFGLEQTMQPVFGLNPGAEYGPAKRWPIERFIAAAKEIQQRTKCVWVILGGAGDMPITNQIESGIQNSKFKIHNLAGRTSLRELMSLLKLCRVLLTNDSGPMHVAAALGTPVVVPFGSTSPELTGPGLPGDPRHRLLKSDAPCSPCFLRACPIDFRCMTGISVDRVVEAVLNCSGDL